MKNLLILFAAAIGFAACEDATEDSVPSIEQLLMDGDYDAVNLLIEELGPQSIDQEQLINDLVTGGIEKNLKVIAEFYDGKWQTPIPVDSGPYPIYSFIVFNADLTGWMYHARQDTWAQDVPSWFRSSSTWGYDPQNSTLTIQTSYRHRYDQIDRVNWEIIEGEVTIRELNIDYKVLYHQSPMVILQADRWRCLVNLQEKSHNEWIESVSNYGEDIWITKIDKK